MLRLAAVVVLALTVAGGCFGSSGRTQWAFTMTQLDQAPGLGLTGEGITVAVIDTGIDPSHAALKHLVNGDVGDGELVAFKDYISDRNGVAAAYDDDGHGTHVAGIITAQGSTLGDKVEYNGVDLLGGAPHVRLVVARVCRAAANGTATCDAGAIGPAITWSVQQGARVVSLSLGGGRVPPELLGAPLPPGAPIGQNPQQRAVQQAVQQAVAQGVVVIAAAGNSCQGQQGCTDDCTDVTFPSDIPSVIAVAAVTQAGAAASFSCRGDPASNQCQPNPLATRRCDPDKKPEVAAPGESILSSWREGGYAEASGTSQATPFVTATVALMLQHHAALTSATDVEALKQVLESTARPAAGAQSGHDDATGYGILQARAAVAAFDGI